ncbi:MAG: hypothetical protein HYV67_01140 [Candidatus Taylorbacteria bacterium]|nr:hypothetical protein [Candidatus Taylorbacteria bacterium]
MNTTIAIFRHGHTDYRQGNRSVSIEMANDLSMPSADGEPPEHSFLNAVNDLKNKAKALSYYINPGKRTVIHSSGTGRTLSTAKIIQLELASEGLAFERHDGPWAIHHEPLLDEVGCFDWKLFLALVNGGYTEFGDDMWVIDPQDSNPKGLGADDYFYFDCLHKLPGAVLKKWPEGFASRVKSFETSAHCLERLKEAIRNAARQPERQWIFVTHGGLAAFPVRVFTNHQVKELERGSWALLDATDGKATIRRLCEQPFGNKEANLLEL